MDIKNDPIGEVRAAKEAVATLTTTAQALLDRHDTLGRERRRIFGAMKSRPEVLASSVRLVDETWLTWWQRHGSPWVYSLSGHRELRSSGVGTTHERMREVAVPPRLPSLQGVLAAPGAMTFDDLCALAPDLVKASLAAAIRAMPDDAFGLPEDERQARLADLDAQIANVETQHSELVDAAASVGITLPLLPAVRERRALEPAAAE